MTILGLNERHTAFDWIVASSRQMASQVLIVLLFFLRTYLMLLLKWLWPYPTEIRPYFI